MATLIFFATRDSVKPQSLCEVSALDEDPYTTLQNSIIKRTHQTSCSSTFIHNPIPMYQISLASKD